MQTSNVAGAHSSFREAVEAVGGRWADLVSIGAAEDHLGDVVQALEGLDAHDVPSLTLGPARLCYAVCDAGGRVRLADAAFQTLFAGHDPQHGLKRLITKVQGNEAIVGLAEGGDHEPVAICVTTAAGSEGWPLSSDLRAGLADARRWVAMAVDPKRQPTATAAAATFGLSDIETRVAFMMLEVPTIGVAAERLAIGHIIARNALNSARRKVGARSITALTRRLTNFACNLTTVEDGDSLAAVLPVTPAEARVAELTGNGVAAVDAASSLGISLPTVRTHIGAILGKLGIDRTKDLGRISAELIALTKVARASEIISPPARASTPFRIIARPNGRHVAFIDYGPMRNRPLLFCHALASGRTLAPNLLAELQGAGYRPIVPQRPGYGLTDRDEGDYLATAAEDMAGVLDALRIKSADVFARDIASAPALAFAERFGDRIERGFLLNPQAPSHPHRHRTPLSVVSDLLQHNPDLIRPFFEVLRRQLSTKRATAMVRASFKGGVDTDVAAVDDPALMQWLTSDMQAMVARSAVGPIRERLVYASGWQPPSDRLGGRWTVAYCAQLGDRDWMGWWTNLPDVSLCSIPRGGLLLPVTHPKVIVSLLTGT